MPAEVVSLWYREALPGEFCDVGTRCPDAQPDGSCDSCDTVNGRWVSAVSDYASTCDGPCGDLTMHEDLVMDPVTQLGYCANCIQHLPLGVLERILKRGEQK